MKDSESKSQFVNELFNICEITMLSCFISEPICYPFDLGVEWTKRWRFDENTVGRKLNGRIHGHSIEKKISYCEDPGILIAVC